MADRSFDRAWFDNFTCENLALIVDFIVLFDVMWIMFISRRGSFASLNGSLSTAKHIQVGTEDLLYLCFRKASS